MTVCMYPLHTLHAGLQMILLITKLPLFPFPVKIETERQISVISQKYSIIAIRFTWVTRYIKNVHILNYW